MPFPSKAFGLRPRKSRTRGIASAKGQLRLAQSHPRRRHPLAELLRRRLQLLRAHGQEHFLDLAVDPSGSLLVGLVVLVSLKGQVQFNVPGFSLSIAIGILGFFGAFMYLVAVSKGPLTLVAPITAFYPMFAILLGVIFLHETITIKQAAGIGLSLVAIYLISS